MINNYNLCYYYNVVTSHHMLTTNAATIFTLLQNLPPAQRNHVHQCRRVEHEFQLRTEMQHSLAVMNLGEL